MRISVTNIRDMLADDQEELVREYIGMYSCEMEKDGVRTILNPDIERFLNHNSIQFAKMKTAVTYLVIDEEDGALLGYFTLAHKPLKIVSEGLSRHVRDQLKRFSKLDEENRTYTISAFLLAQFGKNYAVENGERISGTELMKIAIEHWQMSRIKSEVRWCTLTVKLMQSLSGFMRGRSLCCLENALVRMTGRDIFSI